MGRKRKPGKRYPCGKLSPYDHGAEHVTIARARFGRFQDGKAAQQVHDPIGRAWAVGLLENDRFDPAVLRDAGRAYAERYWGYYPSTNSVANYEGEDRRGGSWGDGEDPRGEHFQRLDRLLLDAGRVNYDAVHNLVIDTHWFPDDNPPWLDRLINQKLVKANLPVAGGLPRFGDGARMVRALCGLLSLVEGTNIRARAFAA